MEIKNWKVTRGETLADNANQVEAIDSIDASVPSSVHYDLMETGFLENPYASTKNAFDSAWVARTDWIFETSFDVTDEDYNKNIFILKFNGVDTFSEIFLNDKPVGKTANAYKIYEFRIDKSSLKKEKNILKVHVKAHARGIENKMDYAKRLRVGDQVEGLFGKAMIRRYQRNFFSGSSLLNLGTGVLGIGIFRPVELLAYDNNYIKDYYFTTNRITDDIKSASCELRLELFDQNENTVEVSILDKDKNIVFTSTYEAKDAADGLEIELKNPNLWNPRGYGEAYLYELNVRLLDDRKVLDVLHTKIGIKTVALQRKDGDKNTFSFIVNGNPVIVHGQNHIPLDYIKIYQEDKAYDNLFKLLENQNVNLVRMWGGGAIETPEFYNRMDESGIMLWQDMFLHSNVYPDFDEEWTKDFLEECDGIIRQVRNLACCALICGGNEQHEAWDEWGWKRQMDYFFGGKLGIELIPPIAEKLCPQIPYIVNSPHEGATSQSPVVGESHIWGSFYNSTKDPLFVSETCWNIESYSRPETLKKYMGLDVDDYVGQEWNERWNETTSLPFFNRMPFTNWFAPYTLRSYLHGLELEQMRADYQALSNFRYGGPSNKGIIYWSFNKGGPLFQFGCVDYDGYPMMSYYAVKRIFAPIGIYPYRDVSDICVMLSNQSAQNETLKVEMTHYGADGCEKSNYITQETISAGELKRVLRAENLYEGVVDRRKECVYVRAYKNGETIFDDIYYFCPFGEFEGDKKIKEVKYSLEEIEKGEYLIKLSSPQPIRQIEIEANKKILCTDNYFPLLGEKSVRVTVLDEDLENIKIEVSILKKWREI
jgi:beta-mannosidase